MKRTMSALGNRNFAAPEIINKVRANSGDNDEHYSALEEDDAAKTTETISNFVADYGLLVDSYSMGHTIRYMMTGVQPGISVEDAIREQGGGFLGKLFSLCASSKQDKGKEAKRSVRYRRMENLPGGAYRLVGILTEVSETKRISIRKARWTVPWIADVLGDDDAHESPPSAAAATTSTTTSREETTGEAAQQRRPDEQVSSLNKISYLPFAAATITDGKKAAADDDAGDSPPTF